MRGFVCVLLGLVAVDRFLFASRSQLRRTRLLIAAELVNCFRRGLDLLGRDFDEGFFVAHQADHLSVLTIQDARRLLGTFDSFLVPFDFHGHVAVLPSSFDSLDDLNAQGRHWLDHTANARLHSTTERIPSELFAEQEQAILTAYATVQPYRVNQPVTRGVSWESLVHYQGSRYSVPPAHAGKTVHVIAAAGMVSIRCGDLIIAEHPQALKSGQCLVQREHLDELWKLAVARTPLPDDQPRWQLTGAMEVQQRPLRAYEEVTA